MTTFSEFNLSAPLLRAIGDLGFLHPSPIQAQTLPILLSGPTDFIGLAATGTGKTAAFVLPMLQNLDGKLRAPQALILCPTRELVLQVSEQVERLGRHLGVRSAAIYGGSGYEEQFRALKSGAQVVVGTPGRLIDHLDRGSLKLEHVKWTILDEADEMISMGFREDIETILSARQGHTWLFSATMSPAVRKVADQFLEKPQTVQVNRTEMLSSTIEQQYVMTQEKNKPEILCKLIDAADDFYGLVFCQTKVLVVELTRYLTERGYKVDCLHGDKTQSARELTLKDFRSRRVRILVCTDVAARGLDVKDVTHVINYSIPRELDNYVHRIGRTARSGKTGVAISLVSPSHRYLLGKIEQMTKSKITEIQPPTRKALGLKKVAAVLEKVLASEDPSRAIELIMPDMMVQLETMSGTDVAARFLTVLYPEVFAALMEPRPPRQQTSAGGAGKKRKFNDKRWRSEKNNKKVGGQYPPRRRPKY